MVPSWLRPLFHTLTSRVVKPRRRTVGRVRTWRPQIEILEDRWVPASYTWDSTLGTLAVSLGTGESVTVTNNAGTRSLALSAGTFTQVGGNAATGSGSATLSFAAGNNIGGSVVVNNVGAAAGTNNVTFNGIGSTDSLTSATIGVTLTAAGTRGTIAFTNGFDTAATAALTLTTAFNIGIGTGSVLSSSGSGTITLSANQQATATSGFNFAGIRLDGGTITTSGTGAILLQGRGGDSSLGNHGIVIQNAGQVQSTASTLGAGAVTLAGTGGKGTVTNSGVLMTGAGSQVTSVVGDILITGNGGDTSTAFDALSIGVSLTLGAQVTSTGTAKVTLDGTGGNGSGSGTRDNYGVLIQNANSRVSSVDGAILVTGQGGLNTDSDNYGVFVDNGGQVRSSGAALLTLDGTGGNGTFNNHGVFLRGTNTLVTSVDSAILIQGQGGNGTSGNIGVALASGARVTSTGTATVTLDGTGGTGTSSSLGSNIGVSVDGAGSGTGSVVTSVTGDILLKGKGGTGTATSSFHAGVHLANGGQVISTGSAKVSLDGTGGAGASSLYGVIINEGGGAVGSLVRAADGAILIKGRAGDGTGPTNVGVSVQSGGQVASTGAASITLDGTGGIGTTQNIGVWLVAAFSPVVMVTSATGDIRIVGIGGGGAVGANRNSNTGVTVESGAQVASTGAAKVTIDGTGGAGDFTNHGVNVSGTGTLVTALNGAIAITGQGGAGTPSGSNGTFGIATSLSAITSTGSADLSLVADTMNLGNPTTINVGASNSVTLTPRTPATAIDLGGADALGVPGTLGLLDAELDTITAGTLFIGDAVSGTLTVSSSITRATATDVRLTSGADIIISGGPVNTAGGPLQLQAGAAPDSVKPTNAGTDATASTVTFGSALTIDIADTAVDGKYTQFNVAGTIVLTGNALVLTGTYTPLTGNVFVIVQASTRTGQFTGLAENDEVTFKGKQLRVNYTGTTVTLTALGVVAAPDAVNDTPTVAEDSGSNTLSVLANDTPAGGLTITAVTQGANGAVAISGGAVTYTPNGDFFGTDTFTYTVADGSARTDTATATVTITAVNDLPDAANDTSTVLEDSGATSIDVLSNDKITPDVGETLTITAVTQGSNGTVAISSGMVTYRPNANFFGSDSFTYSISDGNGGTDTATVGITVTAANDPPTVTQPASATLFRNGSFTFNGAQLISVADVDAASGALKLTLKVTNGTLTLASVGGLTFDSGFGIGTAEIRVAGTLSSLNTALNGLVYRPTANTATNDSLAITINDQGNTGGPAASASASISLLVTARAPRGPVGNSRAFSTPKNTTLNVLAATGLLNAVSSPDNVAPLTITNVSTPGGTLNVVSSSGSFTYTPAANFVGTVTFTYTVFDGLLASDPITVTVHVGNAAIKLRR